MGAKVSVCNLTAIVINIALKHLGPVHYANEIMPKQCANFTTGQVWFTVEARVWSNGTNNYDNIMLAAPIAGLSVSTASFAALLNSFRVVENNSDLTQEQKEKIKKGLLLGRVLPFVPAAMISAAAVAVNERDRPDNRLIARRYAVFMTNEKIINVLGGPSADTVDIDTEGKKVLSQTINLGANFNPISIEESKVFTYHPEHNKE